MMPNTENISEIAQEAARQAAYRATLPLAKGNQELADLLSTVASQEAKEKSDLGTEVLTLWRCGYVNAEGRFFREGIEGHDGVDAYMTIEAHIAAYNAFDQAMVEQRLQMIEPWDAQDEYEEEPFRKRLTIVALPPDP